jgi:hypothetical protein
MALARRVKPTGEKSSSLHSDDSTDLPDEKYGKKSSWFRSVTLMLCSALFVYGISETTTAATYVTSASSSSGNSITPSSSTPKDNDNDNDNSKNDDIASLRLAARQQYENCTISYQPPPPRTDEKDWRKPLWVPSLPASGASGPSNKGDLMKALIDSVTGLNKGTKNYHMSMRNRLRRCRGISETAACTQGHPYVKIGPETQTDNFQSSVLLALRNPRDAFPAGHTDKNIAYHNAKGQPPEREWRKVRDEYSQRALSSWKEMIEWWTTNDYYKVALFVPYEQLLHPTNGPKLVQRLATVYQQAGFEVAPNSDIPCLWYKAVTPEWHRQDVLMEYVPGYRASQRDYYLTQLQAYMEQIIQKQEQNPQQQQGDLLAIVRDYYNEIRDHTQIDEITEIEEEDAKE